MKGLRKYIAPFAPDQSGATAVFCELGGLVIILDAGGCAGNVCGFDEKIPGYSFRRLGTCKPEEIWEKMKAALKKVSTGEEE